VPGCDCPADACASFLADEISYDLAVCGAGLVKLDDAFPGQSGAPYFDNIVNQSSLSFCDAVDADVSFQARYGRNAEPYVYQVSTGSGDYEHVLARSGLVTGTLGQGTCEVATEAQSTCGKNSNDTQFLQGLSYAQPGCIGAALPLPVVNLTDLPIVGFSGTCRGFPTEALSGAEFYLEVGGGASLCDLTGVPFLTAEDWNEPTPGRRYMCREFDVEGLTFYVFLVSLGNEPCREASTGGASGVHKPSLAIALLAIIVASYK